MFDGAKGEFWSTKGPGFAGLWIWNSESGPCTRLNVWTPSAASRTRLRRAPLGGTMKRKEFDHIRLDRLHPLITGNADAVVTVLDEVRITKFVQPDRWQV